ncbi:hypothetical protein [Endozoicomonas ascidiicola]|uniref:hypothetical protein n=1 Tax=Endozoicomonas ascidiicola TaxID=1698521 RepID=UPI0008332531|nr:hypothetical protein [Endozoicomonas ascidiicola]
MSSTPEDKSITGRGSKVATPKNNLVKDGVENAKESSLTRERRSAETKHQKMTTTAIPETEGSASTVSQTTTPDNTDVDELQTLHLKLQNELNINMESARDWHFLSILLTYSSLCPEDSTKLDPIIEKANTNISRQTMALFYSQLVEYRDIIKSFDTKTGNAYSNIIDDVETKATAILNEADSEESSKGKALFDLIDEAINRLKPLKYSGKFGLFFKGLRDRQLETARLQQPLSNIAPTNENERVIAASFEQGLDRATLYENLYEKLHQLISSDEFEQAGRLFFFANAMIRGKEGTAYNHKKQNPFMDKLLDFESPSLPSQVEHSSNGIQNDFEYGMKVALILASLKSYGGIWNEDYEFGVAFSFLQMLSGDNPQFLNNLLEQMTLSDEGSRQVVKELTLAFQASYEYYLYTMVYPNEEKQRASETILRKLGVDTLSEHFSLLQAAIGRIIGPMSAWESSRSTPAEIITFLINKFDEAHGRDGNFNNLQVVIHINRMGVQSPKYRTEFIRAGLTQDNNGLFSLTIGDSTEGSIRYSGMTREQLTGTTFNELFSHKIKHLLSLHFKITVGNDVSIPIQMVPASIHYVDQLIVLQGSPLSLRDIISTPVSQLPQLERTRMMELTQQFFNTMKDRAVFTTLITPETQRTAPPTDTATALSNLTAEMQELLAIKKATVDGEELIQAGTAQLFKNVLKGFTGILRLCNDSSQSSDGLSADAKQALSEFSSMVSDVLDDTELSIPSDIREALSEFNTQSQVYLSQHTEATTTAGNHQEPESQTKETSVIHSPGSKVLLNPRQLLRWIVGKLKGSETDAQTMTEQELVAFFKEYEGVLGVFTPEESTGQTEAPSLDTDQAISGLFKNSLNEIMEWHQGSHLEVHPDKNSYRILTGNQPSFNLLSQWQKCFDESPESHSEPVSQTLLPPDNPTRSDAEDVTASETTDSSSLNKITTQIPTEVPETTPATTPVSTTQSTQFILQNVLINAVKDTWVYKLQLRLLKYRDEAPDGNSVQPVINALDKLIKADQLKVLKSWISAFAKATQSSDPATARRFTSILDSINSHKTGNSEDEHSRKKRSPLNPFDLDHQVFSLLNQLASDEKAAAFTRFSQGIQSSITKHSLKLNNQISDSTPTRSESLAEESKSRVITPSEMDEVKQRITDYFAEGDYYSAGQTSFDLGEISVNQHILARSTGNSESITETNDAETSLSQSDFVEIDGNVDASLFEASCFMAIVTNPLFVRDVLAGCTGYCKGFSFIQAIAGMKGVSLNYRLLDMLAENQLDAGTLPQAIAVLQMLLNISHSSHLPDLNPEEAAFETERLKYFGFKKESLVFKNLLNKVDAINVEYHGLETQDTTLDTALDVLVDFYEAQKGAAQTSEIKGAEVGIVGTFYIKVPHMIRLALEENLEGGFYIIYENSQSSLIKVSVSSLSELKTDKVRQQFGKIIRSDLRNRYSYTDEQLRLVKLTPSILSEIASLQILPTSFSTLGELVATPPSERALLDQGRKLQKLTELLTKLSQPSTRDAIRQGAFEGLVEDSTVNPNKVSSLSSFNQKVREVLEAIGLFERQGTALSSERIELIQDILGTVTNELKLINSIPATVLGRWLTQEKLNNLRQLSQAMEALKEATAGEDFGAATDLNDAVTKLNTEVAAFSQKTQSISISELQLPDAESHPLPEKTVSKLKKTLKEKAHKIALEETPSTSSATKEPSSESIEKAEEQVATHFKDGADFFMAVVGAPSRNVGTPTESNSQKLSNALNEAADQGLKETAGAGESWSRIPGKNDDAIDRLLKDESVRAFLKLRPSDFVSITEGDVTVTAKVVGGVATGIAEIGGVAFAYRATVGEWSILYKPVGSSGAYMDAKDLPELEDLDISATDLNNNVQKGIEKLDSAELDAPDVPDTPLEDVPVAKKPRVICKRDLGCVTSETEEGAGDSFADLVIDTLEEGAVSDGLADTALPAGAFFAGSMLTVVGLGAAGSGNQNEQPPSPPANSPSDSDSYSPVTRSPNSGNHRNNQDDADRPATDQAATDRSTLTTTTKPEVKPETTTITPEQTQKSTEKITESNVNVTTRPDISPTTEETEKTTSTPTSAEQTTPAPTLEPQTKEVDKTPPPASTVSQTTESGQEETTPVITTVQDEPAQRTTPESTTTVTGEVATSNENASTVTSSTSRIRNGTSAVSNSTLASPATAPFSTPAPSVEITTSANQNLKNSIDQLLQGFFKNSWISALFQQQKTILQSLPSSTASPALSFNQQKLDIFYRIAKLIALKEFTRAFITGVRTSDPDLASEYKTLGDYLSGRIEQIKQEPKTRAKRSHNGSDGSESTKQEWTQYDINNFVDETLETFMDLLGESDHNQAFIEFSQGYKKRQDEYRKFIHDDVDEDDMSESDALLERSATEVIDDTPLNQLKVAAAHSVDDQNYFQAGKQIFDIEMIETNVELLLSGKGTVSQQSEADNLSEYSGIFSNIVSDAGEAVGTFSKFSILASALYAQVFSNPLLHQDLVLKCAGYCMGRTLFDAVSEQNPNNLALWNLLDDLFSPNGSPTVTLNAIVALQMIADQADDSQSENPEARHRATQALRKLQHLGYETGSQTFQELSSQLHRLNVRFFSLPHKTVAIENVVGECVKSFRLQEATAEQQGQTFNSQQFFVNLSETAGVTHVVRISVTKNAADKYMITYENTQSVMFKIAADTLDELASDENSEQFATHIANDLQGLYEYTGRQITLTKATAAFMGILEDLVVLHGSALTVKDIATASRAELPVLEQQRQIGLFTDFFNFLAGTSGFQALKQAVPEGIRSLPFTVTTKSPLIDQAKELLVSLHQKTEAGTPIPIQTKLLVGNVLKKITGTLKLVNGMSDAEFSAGITEANLPLLQRLSQAIEAFKTTSLAEADDAEMSHLFGGELSEFIVEATKFSAKVATASTADRSQLPSSSSHKESELSDSKKAQLKTAINQKALKNAQLQAAQGASSSQPTPAELRQAKEQLAVSAQDGAHLFFSLTGRSLVSPDSESIESSSLSEESILLNEKLDDIALTSLMEELERFPSFAKVAQHESDPIEDLFNDPVVDKFLGQKASMVTGGDNVAGKVVGGIASGVITLGGGLALTYRVIKSGDGALQTVYRPLGQSNRALTPAEQQEADDLVSQEMNRRLPDANNDPLEPENSVEERIPVECGARKKRSLEPCIPEEPEAVEETALEDGAGDSTLADVLIDGVVDSAFADEAVDAAPVLGAGAGSLLLIFGLSHSGNNQQRPSTTTATTTTTTTTKRPESHTQKTTTTEVTKTTKPANKPITASIPTTNQAATTPEETAPREATHTKTTTPVTSDSTIPTTPATRTTPSVTEITSGSTSSSEEQPVTEPETTEPTTTTPSEELGTTQGEQSTLAPPATPPSEEEETTQAKVSTPVPSTTTSKKSGSISFEPPVAKPSLKPSRDLACKVLVKFDFPEWFARGVFTDEQVNHMYGNMMGFLESSLGTISEYLSSLPKATTLPVREARDLAKMFLTDDAALVVRTRLLSDIKFKPCVSREGEASYENDMAQKREIIDLVRLTWVKDKWFKEFASRRQGRVTRSLDHSRHSHRSTREKKRHILREFDRDLKRLEEEKSGAGNTEPAIRGRRKRAASRHSDELNEIARVQGVLRMVTNQLQSFEGVQLPEKNVRVRKNRKLNCRILGRYKPSSSSKSVASESSDSRVLEAAYNSLPSKLVAVQSMLTALLKHPRAGKINGLVPLLKMLKKMKALSNEREKLLRHGKFYQPCTDKKGRPIAATSPEQTRLLIKQMRQFDVTVKQFEKANQHLLSTYRIPSVTLHTRRSSPLGLSREAEIRVLRSIQTELEKSRRLVKQLKVATVKEVIQPAIRPVASLGTNTTAPADNVVRYHHRRDTDAAPKPPAHHNRKLLSVGSEHLEDHRPLDGLFRENNDYQKPMSSSASRLESPINKGFQILSTFAKEILNPDISAFFSQFTSYFNGPVTEESSEKPNFGFEAHASKENSTKELLKETDVSEASTRQWSSTVTVLGKCEGESNDCKAQVGVMTTHSDDPAFCHSQTQTPEDGKQCSSFKIRANSETCEETEALNMENLFSKRRFSGNENSSWDDSLCDEQEILATAAGSIKEMMKERALSKWQKSADYLNGTHGLHMPFTHKPTFLQILDLFESSHGSLPEGFQRNDQGDILLTVTGESAFQFDLTNNQMKGEQPETELGVVTPERIDSIRKAATMDSRMAAYLQWQPIIETPRNLAEVLNLLVCKINDRSMIKGHWSDIQKAQETGSHASLIGVLQDGTDIASDLYKDVKNYIKLAENSLCDMSYWTDSDLICISILQIYLRKTKELRSDALAKRFISELLDSPVGPESQSYSDLFDVEENGGVRIRGRHAEDNIKGMSRHRFFKLATVYRQVSEDHPVERIQLCSPQNGNRLELVRCMLNVMARSCFDNSGSKYIDVARQLLKEKRRINESNTEQVSLYQCQQLVDDWCKEAQNSEPDLKTRYVTDLITLINKKLKSFDINSQDRIPLSIAIWERLHQIKSLAPDTAVYHSLLKDKAGQLADLYHQSYSNAVSSMPETMSSQDIDVVKELHRDIALICFHQLVDDVDSNELAHKISSMVSKEWQVVAKEHEEVSHETGAGFVRVSNITSPREKDLIKSLNRLPQQSNLYLPAACMPISLSAASTSTLPATMS